jgi:hypothetical protein
VLTAAHAIAYQQIEERISPFQVVLYMALGTVLAFQIAGALKRKKEERDSSHPQADAFAGAKARGKNRPASFDFITTSAPWTRVDLGV